MAAEAMDRQPHGDAMRPSGRVTNPLLKRQDPLWGLAPTVDPRDLPLLGVQRKPEREARGAYYLVHDVEVVGIRGARTAQVLDLAIDLPGGGRRQFSATVQFFSPDLVGARLAALFAVHEGPAIPPHGIRYLHIHLLRTYKVWRQLEDIEPVA